MKIKQHIYYVEREGEQPYFMLLDDKLTCKELLESHIYCGAVDVNVPKEAKTAANYWNLGEL